MPSVALSRFTVPAAIGLLALFWFRLSSLLVTYVTSQHSAKNKKQNMQKYIHAGRCHSTTAVGVTAVLFLGFRGPPDYPPIHPPTRPWC